MPSIDQLVAARYGPTAPHPLRRRPWRRAAPTPPTLSMSERVLLGLSGAERTRRRHHTAALAGWSLVALLVCVGAGIVLRWPHLGLEVVEATIHAAGALVITLAALRRIRDSVFAAPDMVGGAAAVTALLVILVSVGLGYMLWTSEPAPARTPPDPAQGEDTP